MKLGGREWVCVLAADAGKRAVLEEWCPRGELPSRATMILSRTRWPDALGASPAQFVQLVAETTAEGSSVRPSLRLLHADDRTAAGLLTFEDDVLMGDHWQLQLAHRGRTVSVACTLEADGSPPGSIEPELRLATALVSAPTGVPTPYAGPTADAVQAAASRLKLCVAEDTLDADLDAVDLVVRAAEALPLTLAANECLAELAIRLCGAPGADFLGFTAEALRLFRSLLKRTNRKDDPVHWALYARGALLARAELTAPRDLMKLIAACEGALEVSLLHHRDPRRLVEQAILWHAAGELLVRAGARVGDQAPYERAVTACTRSHEAVRELGKGFESFAYSALECRARAQRGLGSRAEERATLAEALELAPVPHRDQIEARLHELATPPPAPVTDPVTEVWDLSAMEHFKKLSAASHGQVDDRVVHLSPFRRQSSVAQILVLRPLVTALAPTVPNRFVALFRHAWRFQDEPAAMTLEETLSRALGHLFSFTAVGAEYEAFGVGRIQGIDGAPQDPQAWKGMVEVMTRDPLLSRIVLVYPSDSPGMQWELDLLASAVCERQARFFLVPPHVDAEAGRSTWDRARRALAARHLDIPVWDPAGLVFRHDTRGVVAKRDTFEAVWDGRFAGWLETHANALEGLLAD